jgi:hypothetical protein
LAPNPPAAHPQLTPSSDSPPKLQLSAARHGCVGKLPSELFSQILSDAGLSWYDLQHIRLVCKDWKQRITNGKDPKIRKALFLPTATVLDSNADGRPTQIHFQVDISAQLFEEPGKLPVTVYDLAYKFLIVTGGYVFRVTGDHVCHGDVLVHPGLEALQQLLPYVHPAFAVQDPANPPTAYTGDFATFRFTSLDDLDTLTIPSEQTAGWETILPSLLASPTARSSSAGRSSEDQQQALVVLVSPSSTALCL